MSSIWLVKRLWLWSTRVEIIGAEATPWLGITSLWFRGRRQTGLSNLSKSQNKRRCMYDFQKLCALKRSVGVLIQGAYTWQSEHNVVRKNLVLLKLFLCPKCWQLGRSKKWGLRTWSPVWLCHNPGSPVGSEALWEERRGWWRASKHNLNASKNTADFFRSLLGPWTLLCRDESWIEASEGNPFKNEQMKKKSPKLWHIHLC